MVSYIQDYRRRLDSLTDDLISGGFKDTLKYLGARVQVITCKQHRRGNYRSIEEEYTPPCDSEARCPPFAVHLKTTHGKDDHTMEFDEQKTHLTKEYLKIAAKKHQFNPIMTAPQFVCGGIYVIWLDLEDRLRAR